MSALAARLPGQALTGARNGMPGFHDYSVYRGTKTLEVELPFECPGGCGRRLESLHHGACAVCRGEGFCEPARCGQCGYKAGSRNHRIICGGEAGTARKHVRRQGRPPGTRGVS